MEFSDTPKNIEFKKNLSVNYFVSVLISTSCWFSALTKSLIYLTYLMSIIVFVATYYLRDNINSNIIIFT